MKLFHWMRKGSVTVPKGFLATGMYCGIKKSGKTDSCLIYSEAPCVAAATFTVNRAKAWPVLFSMNTIQNPVHRAILANSGNANCFNGPKGREAVEESVDTLHHALDISRRKILVASTGVIGRPFPTDKFKKGIPEMVRMLSKSGDSLAAEGILTTDTVTKELAVEFRIGHKWVRLGGIAKGSGMAHPNMATMLCFMTTDLAIQKGLLERALREAVRRTFNRLSIDNDMSTNDTVFVLANGLAANPPIAERGEDYEKFVSILTDFCAEISRKMVEDGEGVTKVCEIFVEKARNEKQAELIARQVANSMLVKTMFTGADPNWGRVIGAVGATLVPVNWNTLEIYFDQVRVFSGGRGRMSGLQHIRKILRKKFFTLRIVLHQGESAISFLTSDLTSKYVRINSSYTS
ncbi:MAG: bifunctional glutamate N-acetyltransferase/amino-acid acetyltransferase ArgJ [Candidatus Omnitrophica bacterium]|nr:bifunctional glutamate N-acetyltransferase/amino-acid acetyltransferase ArgJ [Candidatus Omnitrophota bacterium]